MVGQYSSTKSCISLGRCWIGSRLHTFTRSRDIRFDSRGLEYPPLNSDTPPALIKMIEMKRKMEGTRVNKGMMRDILKYDCQRIDIV
jgi:hypothetical protein